MAFKNGLSERLDELRFPSPRSPPSESAFPGYSALSPGHSNYVPGFSRPTGDVRANLQRRFTTDSSKLSSWNFLSQGPAQIPDPLDLLSSFEKKRQHLEFMREQKRRFEEDMKLLDMQHEKEKFEMDQLARDLAKVGLSGPVSEPTTPPEYRDAPVSTAISRPGRFSTSSVTSSPGFFDAFAGSQLTSPQAPAHSAHGSVDRFAGHSLPGSRRNSEKEDFIPDPATLRPAPSVHRYSLPSNNFSSTYRSNVGNGVDSFAATKHLFNSRNEEKHAFNAEHRLSTPDIHSYMKLTEPDDKFPTLSRRDGSNILSTNPDAIDLAKSRNPGPDSFSYHNRHRSTHSSLPQNNSVSLRLDHLSSPTHDEHANGVHSRHISRHSLEGGFTFPTERNSEASTPVPNSRPSLQQPSYSTNDLPTVKGNGFDVAITPPKTHSEHIHHHNASLGRIPNGAMNRPAKQDPPDSDGPKMNQVPQTMLQASAAPFGPQMTSAAPNSANPGSVGPTGLPFPMYSYGIQGYTGQPTQAANQMPGAFVTPNNYGGFPNYAGGYRLPEAASRVPTQRRQTEGDPNQPLTRFTNYPLEHFKGELYGLCKDQHGCRYLQRKLEERNPEHVQLIFSETYMHVIELMTDPFGNYLCQKLLEFSNDEQRTALIDNAAPKLVTIALNQHGTRALQKMIEFISTPEQTKTVIRALQQHVVDLVQDLNGNHVIQKCLNRLGAEDAEFIYEAVGTHCVTVGTHRHGCCVLQRCIDHASGSQKAKLIAQITSNSFALVQDPFGNYVVQYILDLAEPMFTNPMCRTFAGNVASLSKQKFSSNVIEKCLRTADNSSRRDMIEEMLQGNQLDQMLRDSFANYVVQTAMDFADPETRQHIVDAIRPILPSIRQTPHGRRILNKMSNAEGSGRSSGNSSGQATPNEHPPNHAPNAQIPKMLQKPFMYQGPTNGSSFAGSYLSTPGSSSNNTPPSGPGESPSAFNNTQAPAANNFGAPNPSLYAYF